MKENTARIYYAPTVLAFVLFLLLFETLLAAQYDAARQLLVTYAARGQFPQARAVAAYYVHDSEDPKLLGDWATLYQTHADEWLARIRANDPGDVIDFARNGAILRNETPTLTPIELDHQIFTAVSAGHQSDTTSCWNPVSCSTNLTAIQEYDALELWDLCCSKIGNRNDFKDNNHHWDPLEAHDRRDSYCFNHHHEPLCCTFGRGTCSYLRLPALNELDITLQLEGDEEPSTLLRLQQDGFLRKFESSVVLWPTGYLLSLCIYDPTRCGIADLFQQLLNNSYLRTIELGVGIGAPSIALLSRMQSVSRNESTRSIEHFATDISLPGLELTSSNARTAHVERWLKTAVLDHSNTSAAVAFRKRHASDGFSLIMGSSLQAMFDESTSNKDHVLWNILDALLATDRDALILLAHTIHSLQVPAEGQFERVSVISGDAFDMHTRWGSTSDFAISVFRRCSSEILEEL